VWVNNAGADVLTGSAAAWTFDEKLDALWKVDVLSTLRLSRAVGVRMQQRGGGVIINMGWDQAETGMAGDSGELFGATKGAVMAATRSLAKSLAPTVRVNCLAPGWIRTEWGERASAEWQDRARRESLMGRWGRPEDVAQVACFLASPAADFINGQIIHINGGRAE
jgi:3-oxoacyl-[acyl-carrier protein] reductase